ncbi:hypothetical protein BDV30DRAFT_220361 [Aspergillus minisclerotigenes]|uniref:Uncharacterized protein n=1 Tax=Aspergillus minisclerotigenes TaxID=656917 RepID=A0A5N6ILU8_9EURO|nr:hypothetical protein BDV30DRAFT_220361 [Aspergillus minisclerotigenes]
MRTWRIYSTSTTNNQRATPRPNLKCLISISTVFCAVGIWLSTSFVGHPRGMGSAT